MGRIIVSQMHIWYDVSGGVVLEYSDQARVVFMPSYGDPSEFIQAEAMGYGRQIGQLTRDRLLVHCLLAEVAGTEPFYLREGRYENLAQVDLILLMINRIGVHSSKLTNDQVLVAEMAQMMLQGKGCSDA